MNSQFLVACYWTLQPALSVRSSVRPSVSPSVGPSVRPSHFTFFGFLRFLALLLLPKWWSGLNYGPCPPARDLGSRTSGLVCAMVSLCSFSTFMFFVLMFKPHSALSLLNHPLSQVSSGKCNDQKSLSLLSRKKVWRHLGLAVYFPPHMLKTHVPDCFLSILYLY